MKRFLTLTLCLALALTLSGCGKGGSSGGQSADGSVYYLNFKPEANSAWQKLAAAYTEETGVKVQVVTAASGEYETTLLAEMDKAAAPTLFQVSSDRALTSWGSYCYDLAHTDLVGELTTDAYNLYDGNGQLCAVGYCYECFGIIVNTALLDVAGYGLEDLRDFASLKAAADDIHARADELGFDAFTSSGLDSSSSWRFSGHLAALPLYYEFRDAGITSTPAKLTGAYLPNYKNIWDLYLADSAATGAAIVSATGDQAEAEFGEGKAVFYQNGSWEYADLTDPQGYGMDPDTLAMIPIYCGVEGEEEAGLCCGSENCWAVNALSSEEDIQATLDFLYWVVTSEEGTQMMAEQFGSCPFRSAKLPENVFSAQAEEYTRQGRYVIPWVFSYTPSVDQWRAGLVDALTQYSVRGGSWDVVETAFVDRWAALYAQENR